MGAQVEPHRTRISEPSVQGGNTDTQARRHSQQQGSGESEAGWAEADTEATLGGQVGTQTSGRVADDGAGP